MRCPKSEFLEELRRLNGTPGKILEHAELMQIMVPILRADFAVYQTYMYTTRAASRLRHSGFGGLQDDRISRGDLERGVIKTTVSFSLRMFPGDHFFLSATQEPLLQALSRELRGDW